MGSQGFGCALTCDQAFFFEREASKYKRGGYDCRLDVAWQKLQVIEIDWLSDLHSHQNGFFGFLWVLKISSFKYISATEPYNLWNSTTIKSKIAVICQYKTLQSKQS